jgi:plasmid stabilization system protein ParE
MAHYRLTQNARRVVLSVWGHIAEDSELYADRFIDRLMKSIGLLGENPYIGRRRDHDLRTGLYSPLINTSLSIVSTEKIPYGFCILCKVAGIYPYFSLTGKVCRRRLVVPHRAPRQSMPG